MENEIKLLECPFCGAEAEIVPCMGLLQAVRVRCARCKCSTPPVGVVTEGDKIVQLADEVAAEVWNARYDKSNINKKEQGYGKDDH